MTTTAQHSTTCRYCDGIKESPRGVDGTEPPADVTAWEWHESASCVEGREPMGKS